MKENKGSPSFLELKLSQDSGNPESEQEINTKLSLSLFSSSSSNTRQRAQRSDKHKDNTQIESLCLQQKYCAPMSRLG